MPRELRYLPFYQFQSLILSYILSIRLKLTFQWISVLHLSGLLLLHFQPQISLNWFQIQFHTKSTITPTSFTSWSNSCCNIEIENWLRWHTLTLPIINPIRWITAFILQTNFPSNYPAADGDKYSIFAVGYFCCWLFFFKIMITLM